MLGYHLYYEKRPAVIVFEGWDAAGKGGAINRLTERLDPRVCRTPHRCAARRRRREALPVALLAAATRTRQHSHL